MNPVFLTYIDVPKVKILRHSLCSEWKPIGTVNFGYPLAQQELKTVRAVWRSMGQAFQLSVLKKGSLNGSKEGSWKCFINCIPTQKKPHM